MSGIVVEGLVCLVAACWMALTWAGARRDRLRADPGRVVERRVRVLSTARAATASHDLVPPGSVRDARSDPF